MSCGVLAGSLALLLVRRLPRRDGLARAAFVVTLLGLLADVALAACGVTASTTASRGITGGLFGGSVAYAAVVLVPQWIARSRDAGLSTWAWRFSGSATAIACLLGCAATVRHSQYTQQMLDSSKQIPNLSPEAQEAITQLCPTTEPVTFGHVDECAAAVSAARTFEAARQGSLRVIEATSLVEAGDMLFDVALEISTLNAERWQSAIDHNAKSYVAFDFNHVLQLVHAVGAMTGGKDEVVRAGERLKELARADGREEAIDYAVTVHEMIGLALSPRGSLRGYQETATRIRDRYEQAKIRLSMAVPGEDV